MERNACLKKTSTNKIMFENKPKNEPTSWNLKIANLRFYDNGLQVEKGDLPRDWEFTVLTLETIFSKNIHKDHSEESESWKIKSGIVACAVCYTGGSHCF